MMHQPRRWGHAGGRTGIGFERNVAVTVGASRIAIGNRLIVPVGRGETRKQLIDQVAAAIDREARSWGPPPSGFYWVPSIQFEVLPGGNQFYERLNPAFRRWGLSTSARFPVGSSNDSWNGG